MPFRRAKRHWRMKKYLGRHWRKSNTIMKWIMLQTKIEKWNERKVKRKMKARCIEQGEGKYSEGKHILLKWRNIWHIYMGGRGSICFFMYIYSNIYEQIDEKIMDGIWNMMEIVRYESGDRAPSSHNHTNESCGLQQGLLNLPWKLTCESQVICTKDFNT